MQGYIKKTFFARGGDDGWGSHFPHIHTHIKNGKNPRGGGGGGGGGWVSKSGGISRVPPLYKTLTCISTCTCTHYPCQFINLSKYY